MIIEAVFFGLLGWALWLALSKPRTRTAPPPQPSSNPSPISPPRPVELRCARVSSVPRLGSIRIPGNPGEPDVTHIWRRSSTSEGEGDTRPGFPILDGELTEFELLDGSIERWSRHEQVPGLDGHELPFDNNGGDNDMSSQKRKELVQKLLPEMIEDLEQRLSEESLRGLSLDVKQTLVQKSVQDLTHRLFQRLEKELGEKLPGSTMLDFEIELRDDLAQALAGM